MIPAMSDDAIQALVSRLSDLQVRIAQPGDRSMIRQMVMADAVHMLADVPASARSMMVSLQVEGRMNAIRQGHPDAVTLLLGVDTRTVGMLTLDWDWGPAVALLDLMIMPGLRGRGHGSAVLSAVCAVADDRGRPVQTSLFYDSPACRLLRRAGFVLTQDRGTEVTLHRAAA